MSKVQYFIQSLERSGNKVKAMVKFKSSTGVESALQLWETDLPETDTPEDLIHSDLSRAADSWEKQANAEVPAVPELTKNQWIDATAVAELNVAAIEL